MTTPLHAHGLDCKDTAFFLQQDIANVAQDVCQASNQVGNLVSDGTRNILQDNCGNTKDILKEVGDKSQSIESDLCASTSHIVDVVSQQNAQTLLSYQLASKSAAESAECCCELKSLITEKANATDDLIRRTELDALKQKLAKTERELLAVRLRPDLVAPV